MVLIVIATALAPAWAGDITFTNRTASFTSLQGQSYKGVHLVRADSDGLIWRDGASGGRICYTNLDPELLESLGISSNRIEIARARAEHKAVADARYRALVLAEAQAKAHAPHVAGLINPAPSVSWSNGPAVAYGPRVDYGPGPLYPPVFLYGSPFGFGPTAPSAASAASAATAPPAPIGVPAPGAAPALNAMPAQNVVPTRNALPAPSAPSAPPAFAAPSVLRRGR